MWWHEIRARSGRCGRLAAVIAVAALTAGCFQPLYGDHAVSGGSTAKAAL